MKSGSAIALLSYSICQDEADMEGDTNVTNPEKSENQWFEQVPGKGKRKAIDTKSKQPIMILSNRM